MVTQLELKRRRMGVTEDGNIDMPGLPRKLRNNRHAGPDRLMRPQPHHEGGFKPALAD